MNTLDIILIDIICYMSGLFTGLGICFKYKHDLLVKTSSHAQLQDLVHKITNDIQGNTSIGAPIGPSIPEPILASAPMKEIVIRTNDI